MFKRLYAASVIRNILIFMFLLPPIMFYTVTLMYRLPNMQREKMLNYIIETGSDSVLDNPMFEDYRFFSAVISAGSDRVDISDPDVDADIKNMFANYTRNEYFIKKERNYNVNVMPQDSRFNHISIDGKYYSSKLMAQKEPGEYKLYVIYNSENAGYFFYVIGNVNNIIRIAMVAVCLLSLLSAFWEVRPAKRAWRQQKDFFANASHELRTPVTVAGATLELMKDTVTEEQKDMFDIMNNVTKRTANIVSDLMFLSRADAKRIRLEISEINLQELLLETYIPMEVIAMKKGVRFADLQCGEIYIRGDDEKLRQLFSILLKNAIENTPEGGTVWLSAVKSGGKIEVTVKDTGVGIARKDQKRIFQRFFRVDDSRDSKNGNFGLGLSIAHWIVKQHRGKIRIDSRPGEGSSFTVSFRTRVLPRPTHKR